MAKITAKMIRLLSLPKMIGIGPIKIIPPVWTSPVLEVDCNTDPIIIRITPIKTNIIPEIRTVLPLIISNTIWFLIYKP